MPLPRRRNCLPAWVPSGMSIAALPASVGTSISPPSAAVMKLTGTWQCRSSPSRSKMSCFFRRISMYRSPGGPPLVPGSPLPVERMRMPSSMPAGIFTSNVFCFLSLPWPWQVVHGSGMILPVPRQCGQVCCTLKKPWRICTVPAPWQVPQVLALVPGLAPLPWQVAPLSPGGRRSGASLPRAAAHVGVPPGVAVLVVGRTFLRVGEHLVGLFGLLELLFGRLGCVTLVAVRVVLHRQLAIGLLDFFVRGVLGNAQDFVKVSFGHGHSEPGWNRNAAQAPSRAPRGGWGQRRRAQPFLTSFTSASTTLSSSAGLADAPPADAPAASAPPAA